ncbi:MAG: amidohydrolase family protein [Nitrospinae bacterium]|nr:amidohydrolase family protein [Nitrospinota bacterium]
MYDAVITNSTLFGLPNGKSAKTDLAIKDGKIARVGEINPKRPGYEAKHVVDGTGYYTLPGFVDPHSHSDYYLLIDPLADGKIRQGVTTEVGGNCGYSSAPIGGEILDVRRDAYKTQFGLDLDWTDFSQYWKRFEKNGSAVNYAGLVGYNTVRATVLGSRDVPYEGKKEDVKNAVRQNLAQGAAGMSVGLVYPPACFATLDEMTDVVSEVAKAGKIFTTHIRSEGPRLVESIEEVLEITRRTGVKLQISHLKTAGKENWKKLDRVFELIEKARDEGLDVLCDRYPYVASNTGLQVVLPDWAFDGGRNGVMERLADKGMREKLSGEILLNHPEPEYWDTVMVSQVATKANARFEGVTVAKGASLTNKNPLDFIFDLLLEEKTEVEAIYFCMSESNMDRIILKDYVIIGSDAGARSATGPLGIGKPHPRTFGTFPRFFSDYVFRKKLVTMEEAVRKTSTTACERFDIPMRGLLKEGYFADVVMFNPERLADKSTYENPLVYPEGIDYVWVNGVPALSGGKSTGALSGVGLALPDSTPV